MQKKRKKKRIDNFIKGITKGAFGRGCKGPFDPRPALKPAEMRELYGGKVATSDEEELMLRLSDKKLRGKK